MSGNGVEIGRALSPQNLKLIHKAHLLVQEGYFAEVVGILALGIVEYHTATAIQTKNEKGDAYGMKAYAGSAKEWYEQADAFDAYAVGKTAEELMKLSVGSDGKTDAISGCTMAISGMLKNAVKAAD